MNKFTIGILSAALLVGLGYGGRELYYDIYNAGLETGTALGIKEGRVQMKSAMVNDLREMLKKLEKSRESAEEIFGKLSESERRIMNAEKEIISKLWLDLTFTNDCDFYVSQYAPGYNK